MTHKVRMGRIIFLSIAALIMLFALKQGISAEKTEKKEVVMVTAANGSKIANRPVEINMHAIVIISLLLVGGFIGCVWLAKKNGQFFLRKKQMQE